MENGSYSQTIYPKNNKIIRRPECFSNVHIYQRAHLPE